ncbi:hypothetical protein AU187_18855 [Mycobacterium sp. IS-1556]|nr:hypothetical protein AU187_18855 [Mycobacterium sp. IS-1556]
MTILSDKKTPKSRLDFIAKTQGEPVQNLLFVTGSVFASLGIEKLFTKIPRLLLGDCQMRGVMVCESGRILRRQVDANDLHIVLGSVLQEIESEFGLA